MKLAVFLTYGGSMESWRTAGILERELALYRDHAAHGVEPTLVSYGGRSDPEIAAGTTLRVLSNRWPLHPRLYGWLAPLLHLPALRGTEVIKTNQLFGARQAAALARRLRRPLVVRQGYSHYEHRVEEFGASSRAAQAALAYERRFLGEATATIFTTEALAQRAIERHDLPPHQVHVVPNYVVPDVWKPTYQGRGRNERQSLVFFGRFTEQKNLAALIHAAAGLPVELTLIGDGPLGEQLRRRAEETGIVCHFQGRLPQPQLREAMLRADAFVLPSLYEGHPKSLLEAITFGIPVIATRSPGIEELLGEEDFAVVAAPGTAGLREAICRFLEMGNDERQRRSDAARQWALERFSLGAVARQERRILEEIAAGG